MSVTITANPAIAVAWMSIVRKRSSRPSPRRPRTVSLRPPTKISAPTTVSQANEKTPPRASPPIHCATKTATPSATQKSGRNHFVLVRFVIEHLLDCCFEGAREREGEGERRRVAPLLDRVDRLPGHVDGGRELPLREPAHRPAVFHVVLHLLRLRSRRTIPRKTGAKAVASTIPTVTAANTVTAATKASETRKPLRCWWIAITCGASLMSSLLYNDKLT